MSEPSLNLVRICSYCRAEAAGCCLRCALPLCGLHIPPRHRRCDDCETLYHRRRWRRAAAHAFKTALWSAALMLVLALMALSTAGGALALAPLVLLCGVPLMLFRLELHARSRFLSEHKAPRLPTAKLV